MNTLDKLLNSDLGRKLQREAIDETLNKRMALVEELHLSENNMRALLVDKAEIKAKKSVEDAKAVLKDHQEELALILSKNCQTRQKLEHEQKQLKSRLVQLSPQAVESGISQVRLLAQNNRHLSQRDALIIAQALKTVEEWRIKAMSFDEVHIELATIKAELQTIKTNTNPTA